MVERIDNVGLAVRDLQAAEAFYTRLGFRVESRDETPGALLVAGDARLYLFQTNRPEGGARRSRSWWATRRASTTSASGWATSTRPTGGSSNRDSPSPPSRPIRTGARGPAASTTLTAT